MVRDNGGAPFKEFKGHRFNVGSLSMTSELLYRLDCTVN